MKEKILLTMLVGIVLSFSLGAAMADEPISARALYEMDAAEAAETYKGKPVVVKGFAVCVGPDVYSLPSVELSDEPDGKSYVLCVLPYGDVFKLGDFQKGQELTMTGEFRGGGGGSKRVVLKQSVAVTQ